MMNTQLGACRPKRSSRTRAMTTFLVCLQAFLSCSSIRGFQLSMVASSSPFSKMDSLSSRATTTNNQRSGQQTQSVTSSLVSQLAVVALKRRLKDQTHVACDVTANSSNMLLRGRVGPVTVKGRGWQSRLGLTCRAIEATVESCELDMGRVLSSQKLVLTVPAQGRAMVALNAVDFGSFITHPLMKPPSPSGAGDSKLEFLKDDVSIDIGTGAVTFFGTYLDRRWKFCLHRGGARQAVIEAYPDQTVEGEEAGDILIAQELTKVASNFFNQMVFELDGTFLSFMDMMVTSKLNEPITMLSLDITVKKFPSAGIEF